MTSRILWVIRRSLNSPNPPVSNTLGSPRLDENLELSKSRNEEPLDWT